MSNSNGMYKKALKNFQVGKINKSLDDVEKAISANMKNASALNLKGLILYLKGDLNAAELTWKINKDFNDDTLAKSYLRDLNDDKNRKNLYEDALKLMKQMQITEALQKLNICMESDFNAINVYNALSFCYIKKGEYKAAHECVKKVLSIDFENKIAKDNKKVLEEYGIIVKEKANKKFLIIPIVLILALGAGYWVYKYIPTILNKTEVKKEVQKPKEEPAKKEEEKPKTNPETVNEKINFNSEAVQKAIDENNFDSIYEMLKNTDAKNLSVNDKPLYEKAKQIIADKGVEHFYNKGREYFKTDDFGNANKEFLKGYDCVGNGYLRPHIVYLTGLSYEKNNDYENALKYYEKYISENEKGDYAEEVLYKLSTIYYKIDKEKAKLYANKLANTYPDSMYNNSTLKGILK